MDEKIIGIRVSGADYRRIEALAKLDDRKVGTFVKRQILKLLPSLEAEQMALNEPHSPYHAKPKPKPKTVVPKKLRN